MQGAAVEWGEVNNMLLTSYYSRSFSLSFSQREVI